MDRISSSFAMQMNYDEEFNLRREGSDISKEVDGVEFRDLGFRFQELGFCMMELGLCLARICDKLIGGSELEQSLLQNGTAKANLEKNVSLGDDDDKSKLWQQWHYDYGIFTILTAPMFILSNGSDEQECESPIGHTSLQVFHLELNCVVMVKTSIGNFIVQVGESADILSKGRL
ncbi:hypothetical protein ACS0TY_019426 [Phlomoides rotata]